MFDPSPMGILDLCIDRDSDRQKFIDEVEWLVYEEKITDLDQCTEMDKMQLAGLLLKALDNPTEWLSQCKDEDMIMGAFATYLISQCATDKNYYLSLITSNVLKYFHYWINDYLIGIANKRKRHGREGYDFKFNPLNQFRTI